MEASAIQRILIGRGAITLEARSEHRDGIDMLVFGELPRIIQAGKCLGVNLNLARRRRQGVLVRVIAEALKANRRLKRALVDALLLDLLPARHLIVRLGALLVEVLYPVVVRAAFGELILEPEAIGNVGAHIVAATAFAWSFLGGTADRNARIPFGVTLIIHIELLGTHGIGKEDVGVSHTKMNSHLDSSTRMSCVWLISSC